ncbi:MAG: 2-C-methyl-D-erythritol 4-phosphate cytidylyltransferase [Deltaproteobacteria bacterium]|nr:2-C-methyl-D-erythritol 4-phosphate cytidylyltransferase [Deltaproteobacteria bacterium]
MPTTYELDHLKAAFARERAGGPHGAGNGAGAAANGGAAGGAPGAARGPKGPAVERGKGVRAIILAGGSGSRFTGSFIPKQFVQVHGKPILAYVLETYENLGLVDDVTLVVNQRYEQLYYDIVSTYGFLKVRRMVAGAATRQGSSGAGLAAIEPCEIVLVQDGVRPFTSPRVIVEAIEVARQVGAANVVVPTLDTIVECRDGLMARVPDRTYLFHGQAPQAFRYEVLVEAHRRAAQSDVSGATDDAQLVLAAGGRVGVVEGSYSNFKITTHEDYLFASRLVERERAGDGSRW